MVVGPTGKTLLIDLGERAWNATSDTMAKRVAAQLRNICDTGSAPVHPDGQADRAHIEGKVLTLSNDMTAWPTLDLGDGAVVETVAEPTVRGLAPLDDLQELPPQGEGCGEDPPGQRHQH